MLDIDGTLAPIVEHASDAHVPEGTRQVLIAVARRYGLVACVSGRRASEARAMVSIGTISYLGSHGTELLRAGWTESVLDPGIEDWVRRIHEFGREADTSDLRRRRVRVEDKGAIVAFHWRGAPDEDAARSAVDALAARAEQDGLHTHWGRKVLEVRPPVRIDKGAGIKSSFLKEEGAPRSRRRCMSVGDDTTDLDAFRTPSRELAQGRGPRIDHARSGSASAPRRGRPRSPSEADILVDGSRRRSASCCRRFLQSRGEVLPTRNH